MMNPFSVCVVQRRLIQLDNSDDEDVGRSCLPSAWSFTDCLPKRYRQGAIRLAPDDDNESTRVLDEYLDPNSTVGIEPLLTHHIARNDHDSDGGSDQGEDEFLGFKRPQQFLSRNPFASSDARQAIFSEYEDAEFLSDHRISAVLSDSSKISGEHKSISQDRSIGDPFGKELLEIPESRQDPTLDNEHQGSNHLQATGNDSEGIEGGTAEEAYGEELADVPSHKQEVKFGDKSVDAAGVRSENLYEEDTGSKQESSENSHGPYRLDNDGFVKSEPEVTEEAPETYCTNEPNSEGYNIRDITVGRAASPEIASIIPSTPSTPTPSIINPAGLSNQLETRATAISENMQTEQCEQKGVNTICSNKEQQEQTVRPREDFPIISLPRVAVVTPASRATENTQNNTSVNNANTSSSSTSEITDDNNHNNIKNLSDKEDKNDDYEDDDYRRAVEAAAASYRAQVTTNDNDRSGRRSSVAQVAQTILGDRLEDFTEKLAFIKKNIIMSLEDDETWEEEDSSNRKKQAQRDVRSVQPSESQPILRRKPSFDPLLSMFGDRKSSTSSSPSDQPRQHKRSSSLMDMAPSFARFVNQIGTNDENKVFSPSSFFASLAGPEIPARKDSNNTRNDEYIQQQQRQLARQHHHHQHRSNSSQTMMHPPPLPEEQSEEDENNDEEDLFDFSKMIAVGKNVRIFGEDVMGNGLRMFNDITNRVRNANRQQHHHPPRLQAQSDEDEGWSLGREAWI